VQQVAQERGEEYVVNAILGNLGRVGVEAVKQGGTWVQRRVASPGAGLQTQLARRADVDTVIQVRAGSKDDWDPRVNTGATGRLGPKTAYVLSNGHAYITDAHGRVKEVTGALSLKRMDRNPYQQRCAGAGGCVGDEGGHLIAAALGGAGDRINLVPQAATLNRSEWRAMENFLRKELEAGRSVSVRIDVGYPPGGGARPSTFKVTANVDGNVKEFPFENR
jgi:filamentous hemagglutinin